MITHLRIGLAVIFVALVTIALIPVQWLAIRFKWALCHRLPGIWHRIACRAMGVRVHRHGAVHGGRPLLIASNHISWLDILVLGSLADVVFVAKSEVRSWPVFGLFARLQRSVFIEREQRRQTGRQVSEMAQRLNAGDIVVLFAEGTTSDGNRVLDFKSSLFGAANSALPLSRDKTVYIQPVAIAYTRLHGMPMGRFHRPVAAWPGDIGLMPSLMAILREGAIDVDVTFGETLAYHGASERKAATRKLEADVRAMLSAKLRGR